MSMSTEELNLIWRPMDREQREAALSAACEKVEQAAKDYYLQGAVMELMVVVETVADLPPELLPHLDKWFVAEATDGTILRYTVDYSEGIPRDKDYPADSVQCNDCGGWGCPFCSDKGWFTPSSHPNGRKCENDACNQPLAPNLRSVYCSNACAGADGV